jgi:hypothetical protein
VSFQGQLPPQAPRRCAWLPCSRWFTPKPGGNNARYCPDRDCKELAKAKRLRDYHATHRGAGVEPAQASIRPPHPFLLATDAAEAALADGVPFHVVLQILRQGRPANFVSVVHWALLERLRQRVPRHVVGRQQAS